MSKNAEYELPWWSPAALAKRKTDEWQEPVKAFSTIADSMKSLVPWMKFVLGATGLFMFASFLVVMKMLFGG